MIGEGMFIRVIHLLTRGLMPPNAVFDKPEANVLSNDANFFDSAGLACGSCGKRQKGISGVA